MIQHDSEEHGQQKSEAEAQPPEEGLHRPREENEDRDRVYHTELELRRPGDLGERDDKDPGSQAESEPGTGVGLIRGRRAFVPGVREVRINARDTDVFDVSGMRHFLGPNPYLDVEALVFEFALTGTPGPLPLSELQNRVAQHFPELVFPDSRGADSNYATVFARTAAAVGKLGMGLHMNKWSVKAVDDHWRVAVQCLHKGTAWDVVYFVWDWFETLHLDEPFDFDTPFQQLQERFTDSVYGGPSTYSLLRAAYNRGIPTTYLWDEGLMQYGYGRKQLRGASTTFDSDSQLDSDFTCRKDDVKEFLAGYGFPVPHGTVVDSVEQAEQTAEEIGYPVVIKPLEGHKGIGVTANIGNPEELRFAYQKAVESLPDEANPPVIVEKYVTGDDYRLLCVNGEFVAAVRRSAAWVTGDGESTIMELIRRENAKPERLDTPTSPMGKIITDDVMDRCLEEDGLTRDSVLEPGQRVYLRKVANLSQGGVSENVTDLVHPDTVALCRTIAQHLRLTCLGIDVLTEDMSRSWQEGNFGIIEINAAPGIFMHLNPAVGAPVDVPSRIIETFFSEGSDSRVPIFTFNRLSKPELRRVLDFILNLDITLNPGGACREAVYMRRDEWPLNPDFNTNVKNLLRHRRMDVLVAECPESVYDFEGMYYQGSTMVVLEEPTDIERTLAVGVVEGGTVMMREGLEVIIKRGERVETRQLSMADEFTSLYMHEIKRLLENP